MDRFFLPPEHWTDPRLTGDEAHHCLRVMRKAPGDALEVFDGAGRWARGVVAAVDGAEVRLELNQSTTSPSNGPLLTLAAAIPKGKTMDLIVQKAVELGVARILPLLTEHTVVRFDDPARKRIKWQRVALEACKQCGQNHLPAVDLPRSLGSWLSMRHQAATGIVAALHPDARPFRRVLRDLPAPPAAIDLVVGPEGDLTGAEVDALLADGFLPVSFGPIVLRSETAALFGLGALRYEFGPA